MNQNYVLKDKYLALDFDGVIANTIEECLVVGFNAYAEYTGKGGKILDLSSLDSEGVAEARRLRNFIRSGEDYVYIRLVITKEEGIVSMDDFDHFLSRNIHLKNTFFDLFYKEREKLFNEFSEHWIKLNPLYRGMKDFITEYRDKDHLSIISPKKAVRRRSIVDF